MTILDEYLRIDDFNDAWNVRVMMTETTACLKIESIFRDDALNAAIGFIEKYIENSLNLSYKSSVFSAGNPVGFIEQYGQVLFQEMTFKKENGNKVHVRYKEIGGKPKADFLHVALCYFAGIDDRKFGKDFVVIG